MQKSLDGELFNRRMHYRLSCPVITARIIILTVEIANFQPMSFGHAPYIHHSGPAPMKNSTIIKIGVVPNR